jgi:hypothetical protein
MFGIICQFCWVELYAHTIVAIPNNISLITSSQLLITDVTTNNHHNQVKMTVLTKLLLLLLPPVGGQSLFAPMRAKLRSNSKNRPVCYFAADFSSVSRPPVSVVQSLSNKLAKILHPSLTQVLDDL